ncbi:hypothetical protein GGI11_007890, partial [Coemansia sp. RSA 2049]
MSTRVTAEFKHSGASVPGFVLESDPVTDTKSLLDALEKTQRDLNAKLTAMIEVERSTVSLPLAA